MIAPMVAPTTSTPASPAGERALQRRREVASIVALVGAVVVLALKGAGWVITGSNVLLSDALESIVNVVAAMFAIFAVRFAAKPADREHPYGHRKMEHIAAAFEGGLISFAAAMIFYSAIRGWIEGVEIRSIDLGLGLAAGAAVINLGLGWFILREGRATDSATLIADGHHVLSDVWTTSGALVGLALVRWTGLTFFDPVAAIVVGLLLARTGIRLVGEAVHALLDREDPELIGKLVDAFNEAPVVGLTGLHRLRAMRVGDQVHVDGHVFAPEHWTVLEAHEAVVALEKWVTEHSGLQGDLALHLDPCRSTGCSDCDLPDCPIRQEGFAERRRVTVEEAVALTSGRRPSRTGGARPGQSSGSPRPARSGPDRSGC